MAAKVAPAILLTIPATVTVTDRTVELDSADPWRFTDADSPLRIAGAAPGGTITGIAFVGSTMYAVTNTGGLFRVNNPATPYNATATYIASSAQDLQGINFTALCAGPLRPKTGAYDTLLFAMDSNGTLFAFDTAGSCKPCLWMV